MNQINGANLLAMRSLAMQAKDSAITTSGNMETLLQHYIALQAENLRLREALEADRPKGIAEKFATLVKKNDGWYRGIIDYKIENGEVTRVGELKVTTHKSRRTPKRGDCKLGSTSAKCSLP